MSSVKLLGSFIVGKKLKVLCKAEEISNHAVSCKYDIQEFCIRLERKRRLKVVIKTGEHFAGIRKFTSLHKLNSYLLKFMQVTPGVCYTRR